MESARPRRLALLGNVTLDLLAQEFRRSGIETFLAPGFDAWRSGALDPRGELAAFGPDAVALVCEGGAAEGDLELVRRAFPSAKIAAPDLAKLAEETPGFWDERMRRLAGMPFSLAGLRETKEEILWALAAGPKKLLASDADGTLWRGAVSEEGPEGVEPFAEFQRGLLELRAKGVPLVLLSKNDQPSGGDAAIEKAFARVDVPLGLGDFSAVRCGWSGKPGNLLEACAELNLDASAAVFLDDNPAERAQMAAELPGVSVPELPRDTSATRAFLRRLGEYFFSGAGATAEDAARAGYYADEERRREAARRAPTVEDYLDSLGMVCRAGRAVEADVPRLAQMAARTNQFNATTKRRTEAEFAALISDAGARVWTYRLRDRFGEMGLACYVVFDARSGRLTDFAMSCRAMGRTLEHFAFGHALRELRREGLKFGGIDYEPTAKNAQFARFLASVPSMTRSRIAEERG